MKGSAWEDEEFKVGALGPRESCHRSLPIRKRFIRAAERQKTACFSALISHGLDSRKKTQCGHSCKPKPQTSQT